MTLVKVLVEIKEQGKEIRQEELTLELKGNSLDVATIEKRIKNNLSSLQSIFNQGIRNYSKWTMISWSYR